MRIIGGTHKNRVIQAPKGQSTRPTSSQLRETLFNICQNKVEGARFLDLFAGSGAMGLEALSRGARHSIFVEISRDCCTCIQKTIQTFGFDSQITLYRSDVIKSLQRLIRNQETFDIIYVDPPYDKGFSEQILKLVDEGGLLNDNGLLFIEDAQNVMLDMPLSHLNFINSRRYGRSVLHQYQKVE